MRRTTLAAGIVATLAIVQSPASAQGPIRRVGGRGTAGQIPLWLDSRTLGDSSIGQNPDGSVYVAGTQNGVYAQANGTTGWASGITGEATASPEGTGVFGIGAQVGVSGQATGTTGYPAAVHGFAPVPNGTGVVGDATGPNSTGVYASGTQSGITAQATGTTGWTAAINGWSVENPDGVGAQGIGAGIGVIGTTQSCNNAGVPGGCATPGIAGQFVTGSGGTVLLGQVVVGNNWTPVFRVDSTGKGYFNGGTQVGGADFAESVSVAKSATRYGPGDLLVVDVAVDRQFTLAAQPYSTLVAGIYSTKPGVLATPHSIDEPATAAEVPLAIVGIVPCKVSTENGSIQRGDLLVASSTPGYAMKGTDRSRMLGAVIGKALESQREGRGVIEVLVTLQ